MKRTTKMARASKRQQKHNSLAPRLIIVSGVFGLATTFVVLAALLITAGVGVYRYYQSVVPDGIRTLTSYEQQPYQVSLVQDRTGRTLYELVNPDLGIRKLVELKKIPQNLINATIDIENKTYYSDVGIDPVRFLQAGLHDVKNQGGLQGASTLTQQLVKLAVFGENSSTNRKLDQGAVQNKLKEMMIAIGVTRDIEKCSLKCRKDAILQMYLNTVPYGRQRYGVEAAAEYYFGKDVSQLDLAQSAFLAGLPQAPSEYEPVNHYAAGLARQHQVLAAMLRQQHISQAQYQQALAEDLQDTFVYKNPVTSDVHNTIESYFVDWLVNVYLQDPANLAALHIPDLQLPTDVYRGFTFETTLDPSWQTLAQSIVTQQVTSQNYLNMTDGALVAIDPKTNEIKAMIGGVGYKSGINGAQYNMAWERRQPGSSFKPFMYVTAFEHGHFPGETINDSFVQFPDSSQPGGFYTPKNYDLSYHGLVTIRKALANSYNVPAVKTLDALGPNGPKWVLQTANSMGYHLRQQDPKKLGLAFTLGTDEGRLLEEVNAYAVFANGGIYRPYMPLRAIYRNNADGTKTKIWEYKPPRGTQVLSPQFAYLITNILSDTAAKVPAFGDAAFSLLGLPDRPVAAKTGTTSDFKDNLTLGYTPDLVTGVWVGNPNDTEMPGSTGITGAAPIWHQFMQSVLTTPPQQFIQPPGIITATVAMYAPPFSLPGLSLNGSGVTDIFAAGTVPTTFDQPGHDIVNGKTQNPSQSTSAGTTPVPGGGSSNPCNGGRYTYTTTIENGTTVYHYTCQ